MRAPAAARLLGYDANDLAGMPLTALTPPELRGELSDRIRRGEKNAFIGVALRKDGSTFPAEIQGRTVRLGEQSVRAIALRDASERVRVEQSLRESEGRYRLMVEGSDHIFFYMHDPQLRFQYLSPSLREVLGFDPMELIGQSFARILTSDPDNAQVSRRSAQALATGGKLSAHRATVTHKDGRRVTLELIESPILRAGVATGIQGFARDVTELARAEEKLRVSNETLQALIQASPLAIIAVDLEWKVTLWNRAAERLYGWTAMEVTGKLAPHVPLEEQKAYQLLRDDFLDRVGSTGLELRRRRKDGQFVDVNMSIAPLRDAKGATRGLMFVIADMTENKRLESQLRQAQKMDAVGKLAGGLAHDFNNMLTVIAGNSELALRKMGADHPLRVELEEVTRAAALAAVLTRQLLAFSRKQVLHPRQLDLGEVVSGMEGMLRRLIGEDIELVTMKKPELGYVLADPGQIEQVVMNLVVNARDAMSGGGMVTVETVNVNFEETHIHRHGVVPPGDYILLAVSDTGVGMDPATLQHLFEPFYTTKPAGEGTGLGLSTVYGIVQQSGGSIVVESARQRGAIFKLFFPRIDTATAVTPPHAAGVSATRGTETVLVVEDDAPVRHLVREVLRISGYHVLEAAYGDEAIHVAASHTDTIHLLVTDVIMPQMSGPQLAERLCAMRDGLKVLYISGYTGDDIVRRGVGELAAMFLQKPFTPELLVSTVRAVLDDAGVERG